LRPGPRGQENKVVRRNNLHSIRPPSRTQPSAPCRSKERESEPQETNEIKKWGSLPVVGRGKQSLVMGGERGGGMRPGKRGPSAPPKTVNTQASTHHMLKSGVENAKTGGVTLLAGGRETSCQRKSMHHTERIFLGVQITWDPVFGEQSREKKSLGSEKIMGA